MESFIGRKLLQALLVIAHSNSNQAVSLVGFTPLGFDLEPNQQTPHMCGVYRMEPKPRAQKAQTTGKNLIFFPVDQDTNRAQIGPRFVTLLD